MARGVLQGIVGVQLIQHLRNLFLQNQPLVVVILNAKARILALQLKLFVERP